MGPALYALVYSNAWLALTASGLAYAAGVLCGWPLGPGALALPALSMFAVYTFDKVLGFDPVSDALNDPDRTRFVSRWRHALLRLAVLGVLAGLACCLSWGGGAAAFQFVLPVLVGAAYGFPVLPEGWRYRRLKDITGVKNLSVAVTWGMCCVALPATASGLGLGREGWAAVAWVSAIFLVNTVYFDLGDTRGDRAEGTRTLPVVIGYLATRNLLLVVNLVAALGALAATRAGWFRPAGTWVALGAASFNLVYLLRAQREDDDLGFECDVVADGVGLAVGALAWVASRCG